MIFIKVIEFLHVKPGKKDLFVRTKLKSVTNGKVIDNTFSAGHKIDEVKVITRKFQYLYDDENGFHFMNNDDFSQLYINKEMIENSQFMKAGEEVTIILKKLMKLHFLLNFRNQYTLMLSKLIRSKRKHCKPMLLKRNR